MACELTVKLVTFLPYTYVILQETCGIGYHYSYQAHFWLSWEVVARKVVNVPLKSSSNYTSLVGQQCQPVRKIDPNGTVSSWHKLTITHHFCAWRIEQEHHPASNRCMCGYFLYSPCFCFVYGLIISLALDYLTVFTLPLLLSALSAWFYREAIHQCGVEEGPSDRSNSRGWKREAASESGCLPSPWVPMVMQFVFALFV